MNHDSTLAYLEARPNEWLKVTAAETLGSLRMLRKEGYRIVVRTNEDGHREAKYTPPEPRTLGDLAAQVFAQDVAWTEVLDTAVMEASRAEFEPVKEATVTAVGILTETTLGCEHPAGTLVARDEKIVCGLCGEIMPPGLTPGMLGQRNPLVRTPEGRFEVAYETCPECGEQYLIREYHLAHSERHIGWAEGRLDPEIPVPTQKLTYKYPEDTTPDKLVLGETLICPGCKGHRRPARKNRKGETVPASSYTSKPGKAGEPCDRCNGVGLIPNLGPSPSTHGET